VTGKLLTSADALFEPVSVVFSELELKLELAVAVFVLEFTKLVWQPIEIRRIPTVNNAKRR
jgi:hypothetical protein